MKIKQIIENAKLFAKEKAQSNGVAKFIVSFIVAVVMFIPSYILWFFWWLVAPKDFWQMLALIMCWVICLGAIQLFALIVGIILITSVILDQV